MAATMIRGAGVILAACLILSVAAIAQTPQGEEPDSKVVTLDLERLFSETAYGKRVIRQIEERGAELAAENRRIEGELIEEERNLTEQRNTLSVDEFRALADAFDAKVDQIRTEQDGKTREVQRLREVEQQRFFRLIGPILLALAQERNAAVVLDRRSVFLSIDAVDLTGPAIARIDAKIGDGTASGN